MTLTAEEYQTYARTGKLPRVSTKDPAFRDKRNRLQELTTAANAEALRAFNSLNDPLAQRRSDFIAGRVCAAEYDVQALLSAYTRAYYPEAQFRISPSGNHLTKTQRGKHKAVSLRRGWHDFEVYDPVMPFYGLCLELKRDGESLTDASGQLKSDHLAEQYENALAMRKRNRAAGFTVGASEALTALDLYMAGEPVKLMEVLRYGEVYESRK